MTGTIARRMQHRHRLHNTQRAAHRRSKDVAARRNRQEVPMNRNNSRRTVRAPLGRSMEARLTALRLWPIPLRHAHRTVMLPLTTTARTNASPARCTQRQKRRDNRQPEEGQQQNGKKSTQQLQLHHQKVGAARTRDTKISTICIPSYRNKERPKAISLHRFGRFSKIDRCN